MTEPTPWTDSELVALASRYPNERTATLADDLGKTVNQVYQQAYRMGLKKSAEYLASPAANRLDGVRGAASRFTKGNQPWNKGQKGWQAGGRSIETQFKPGRPASESRNYLPIGSLRINADGYLERKTTDDPDLVPARRPDRLQQGITKPLAAGATRSATNAPGRNACWPSRFRCRQLMQH